MGERRSLWLQLPLAPALAAAGHLILALTARREAEKKLRTGKSIGMDGARVVGCGCVCMFDVARRVDARAVHYLPPVSSVTRQFAVSQCLITC